MVRNRGTLYESIPLDHFSKVLVLKNDENEKKEEKGTFVVIPDHMYIRTFKHRPFLDHQPNFYHMILSLNQSTYLVLSMHLLCRRLLIYSWTPCVLTQFC